MHRISCTRAIMSKLFLPSFALSLHKRCIENTCYILRLQRFHATIRSAGTVLKCSFSTTGRSLLLTKERNFLSYMNLKSTTSYGLMLLLSIVLFSCATPKKISYMQDATEEKAFNDMKKTIRVQPGDKISIIVKSKDPQLTELFNLATTSQSIGYAGSGSSVSGGRVLSYYSITADGCIDFPVLGKLKVAGMSREDIVNMIQERLIAEDLVKDPIVTVEFANLQYSVLGEVSRPGQFSIDRDNISLLEAISRAGDLSILGRRDNVMVMREQNGKKEIYKVDLTSADSIMNSPVAYLQQNDIVYVEPNNVRKRQSTVNGNNVLTSSFWISLISLLTTISVVVFK